MALALVLQLVPPVVAALVLEVYPHAFLPLALLILANHSPVILQVKNWILSLFYVEGFFLLPQLLVVFVVLQRLRALAHTIVRGICF